MYIIIVITRIYPNIHTCLCHMRIYLIVTDVMSKHISICLMAIYNCLLLLHCWKVPFFDMILTLSQPVFWKICFLSAAFISVLRGIMQYKTSTFSKILILQFFQLHFWIPKVWLITITPPPPSAQQKNPCKWGTLNMVKNGANS